MIIKRRPIIRIGLVLIIELKITHYRATLKQSENEKN